MQSLKILIIGTTMTPLVKVGGLADVMESLPVALVDKKIDVRILIPCYALIKANPPAGGLKLKKIAENISVPFNNKAYHVSLLEYKQKNKPLVWLINNKSFFGYNGVYPEGKDKKSGIYKEGVRFAFFNQAVTALLPHLKWQPDILHLNDWHTALMPLLLKIKPTSKDCLFYPPKTLLTIHNLAYQGDFPAKAIHKLFGRKLTKPRQNSINFLRQGIQNADLINTVSPSYAKEILTKKFGNGLDKDLRKRKKDLHGILNGINTKRFSPQTNRAIFKNFSSSSVKNKTINKTGLQKELGLKINKRVPLFGLVSRLVEQKGLDILIPAIKKPNLSKMQIVILGTGEREYETRLNKLGREYPLSIKVVTRFDAVLAQKIYAGADFFLMPSRFEPCGLGQMISMRYGTLPVARATGGLKDTVIDAKSSRGANGLTFVNYSASALSTVLNRAIKLFSNQAQMSILIHNAMNTNFSWDASAKEYIQLYKKLIKKHEI